jgi:hypothetical protein
MTARRVLYIVVATAVAFLTRALLRSLGHSL